MRHSNVISGIGASIVALLLLSSAPACSADGVENLIRGVESRYNHAATLSVEFTEVFTAGGRRRRPGSGQLTLRKPGRMRWVYTQPNGKLFVTDGKNAYLYTSADNRVEHSTLKASEDMRAPMAFLLGKLNFQKEFKTFNVRQADGGTWLSAEASNERLPYEKVEMLIGASSEIQQMKVQGRDGSSLAFTFTSEVLNPSVDDRLFHFDIPPGAEVVEAITTASGGN